MLGYFKRAGSPGRDTTEGGSNSKRPRSTEQAVSNGRDDNLTSSARRDPLTIVTWNANGLGVRLGKNWREFEEFMVGVMPDLCCIQEVGGGGYVFVTELCFCLW